MPQTKPTSEQVTFLQAGTGATQRTALAKLRDTVSVKDFGAVGDGVTNDASAINKAITAAIANGGGTVYFPAGTYKCSTRIGTFVNANNITLLGYGAEIQNFAGINVAGLLQFGNAALDVNGMYSVYATTVTNLSILGIKFTSSNVFNVTNPGRWSDQMPISINTAKNVVIRDCSFINQDFASVDFGAMCKNCIVDSCYFYSSQIDAGSANYGVRIFCYGASTSYQNGNGDLSPTDLTTGILKVGYALVSDSSLSWGHENINVVNCQFEQMSHGVMVSAARRGVISGNSFKNMTTRSISLTTYSQEYSCFGNIHYYDTTQQTSLSVSVFYALGQATYKHKVSGDKFTVIGAMPVGSGFSPVKCYINSHDWEISNCTFDMPTFAGGGGFGSISVEDNSEGRIQNNFFNTPAASNCILMTPALNVTSPGYQSKTTEISGNTFFAYLTGAILIWDTTSTPDAIVIKNNTVSDLANTRFIATNFSAAGKVGKLFLEGNSILSTTITYYVFNATANQAVLLNKDILEFKTNLTTVGVANPSTTSVSFNFSSFRLPPCYSSGTKIYDYTIYGNLENAQASTDFYFAITSVTASTIVGNIVRNAGASFQSATLAMTVRFLPYIV
jgi:hypothetical protein